MTLAQPPTDAGSPGSKEPMSTALNAAAQHLPQFISLVHSYLLSMVTLADQKAAFVFTADSAFLGYLLSTGLLHQLRTPTGSWAARQYCAGAALSLLVFSLAAVLNVVMPRLGGKASGLIYFKAIATRKDRQAYAADLLSSTDSSLDVAIAEHSYEIAKISKRKYQSLQVAIWAGIAGFAAGFALIGLGV